MDNTNKSKSPKIISIFERDSTPKVSIQTPPLTSRPPSSGYRSVSSRPSTPLRRSSSPRPSRSPSPRPSRSPKSPEEQEISTLKNILNFFLKPVEVTNPVDIVSPLNINPSFDRKTAHKVIDGVKYSSLKELKQNKLKCFFETCEISWNNASWVDR